MTTGLLVMCVICHPCLMQQVEATATYDPGGDGDCRLKYLYC